MSDDHEFGPAVAGTTLTDDHPMGIGPEPDTDRKLLAAEAQRQLVAQLRLTGSRPLGRPIFDRGLTGARP